MRIHSKLLLCLFGASTAHADPSKIYTLLPQIQPAVENPVCLSDAAIGAKESALREQADQTEATFAALQDKLEIATKYALPWSVATRAADKATAEGGLRHAVGVPSNLAGVEKALAEALAKVKDERAKVGPLNTFITAANGIIRQSGAEDVACLSDLQTALGKQLSAQKVPEAARLAELYVDQLALRGALGRASESRVTCNQTIPAMVAGH
jgi:hypothetical protein